MRGNLDIFISFGAGLLSFLSPCVLPLIPGYLSFISGKALGELKNDRVPKSAVLFRTLFFVSGFSAIFIVMGLVFSGGSFLLGGAAKTVSLIAGLVVMIFGLNLIVDFLKVLNREARFHAAQKPASAFGAFLVGAAFGAGWSPCIGPILASILLYAAKEGNMASATFLLAAYSAGLALPFLAVGAFFNRMKPVLEFFKKNGRATRIASGVFLIFMGAAMAIGKLSILSSWAVKAGYQLQGFAAEKPLSSTLVGMAAWLSLAMLVILPPLLRKAMVRPLRIALLCLISIMAILELSGVFSLLKGIAAWFTFQGA